MANITVELIEAALKEGKLELACYMALLYSRSSETAESAVYLDDAYSDVKESITKRQWAGFLSALEVKGLYKPVDKNFGCVVEKQM